eukprot:1192739-Prorocentrum_minimum.AAC.2
MAMSCVSPHGSKMDGTQIWWGSPSTQTQTQKQGETRKGKTSASASAPGAESAIARRYRAYTHSGSQLRDDIEHMPIAGANCVPIYSICPYRDRRCSKKGATVYVGFACVRGSWEGISDCDSVSLLTIRLSRRFFTDAALSSVEPGASVYSGRGPIW